MKRVLHVREMLAAAVLVAAATALCPSGGSNATVAWADEITGVIQGEITTAGEEDGVTGDVSGEISTDSADEENYGMTVGTTTSGVSATANGVIANGIYIGDVSVGGMTADEAEAAIDSYMAQISASEITLTSDDVTMVATLSELGYTPDIGASLDEAMAYGKGGTLVKRYKDAADLKKSSIVLPVNLDGNEETLTAFLEEHAEEFKQDVVEYTLTRQSGSFVIGDGQNGVELNVEESAAAITDFFKDGWHGSGEVALVCDVVEPRTSREELEQVTDVLGTFTTDYSDSASGRKTNVARGAELINGSVVYPGETFSVYGACGPLTEDNGYAEGTAYENGTTVPSVGGGICQVSTTLYNAVIRAELEIDERYGHSMMVSYVDPSADAAIAGTYKDLKFTNNLDYPIYIEGATDGSYIRFTVYGHETRPSNRTVKFESETLDTIEPTVEFRTTSDPIGTITKVQSSHTGRSAQLWKIVTVDGVEESREVFNKTTYQMSPTIYEVGISSSNADAVAAMQAAIATGDLSKVQSAASQWKGAQTTTEEVEETDDASDTDDGGQSDVQPSQDTGGTTDSGSAGDSDGSSDSSGGSTDSSGDSSGGGSDSSSGAADSFGDASGDTGGDTSGDATEG